MNPKEAVSYRNGKIDPIQVILAIIFIIILLAIGLIGYWLIFDDNPPAIINEHYLLDENGERTTSVTISPGQTFSFYLDWCKKTTASEIVRTTWINDFILNETPLFPRYISPGCYKNVVQRTSPNSLSGNAVYSINVSIFYEVNPLIERHVEFRIDGIIVEEGE